MERKRMQDFRLGLYSKRTIIIAHLLVLYCRRVRGRGMCDIFRVNLALSLGVRSV